MPEEAGAVKRNVIHLYIYVVQLCISGNKINFLFPEIIGSGIGKKNQLMQSI